MSEKTNSYSYNKITAILSFIDVCPLTKNKLSESKYDSQSSCAHRCLQDPFCAGYNFNKKKVKPNCQLTNTLNHDFGDCNINDKGWIFFHPLTPRKVKSNDLMLISMTCMKWNTERPPWQALLVVTKLISGSWIEWNSSLIPVVSITLLSTDTPNCQNT